MAPEFFKTAEVVIPSILTSSPSETHIAGEYVEQLRQIIETRLPQESARAGASGFVPVPARRAGDRVHWFELSLTGVVVSDLVWNLYRRNPRLFSLRRS